jgi:hypothetical protein
MKSVIADVYKIVYRISSSKLLALILSLCYIAIINLILIYGLIMLLAAWYPQISVGLKLFRFPYNLILVLVMVGVNFQIMQPIANLSKERSKNIQLAPLIIYTFLAVIICLYSHFSAILF